MGNSFRGKWDNTGSYNLMYANHLKGNDMSTTEQDSEVKLLHFLSIFESFKFKEIHFALQLCDFQSNPITTLQDISIVPI